MIKPIWVFIFKDTESNLIELDWKNAFETPYSQYGDIYAKYTFDGLDCTYVVDCGRRKQFLNPKRLLDLPGITLLSEVVIFENGLYNGETKKIISLNTVTFGYKFHFLDINDQLHSKINTASYDIHYNYTEKTYKKHNKKYFINGKEYTELEHSRSLKLKRLKEKMSQ